ncbi:inositol-1,4,5-trisphosphate 5-phosphatase' [Musa troglodytarum]|uniref:Inositol-1,4,5-trisphosphate 5-phosphatase n=1 Tax=Musa troglodytarum TaxID=320322 RepID=A0A9E7K5F0_9LILI|nr:inositol-1,4,5-trisphosphate 5-phosphatase' [Musa troglodytarum]
MARRSQLPIGFREQRHPSTVAEERLGKLVAEGPASDRTESRTCVRRLGGREDIFSSDIQIPCEFRHLRRRSSKIEREKAHPRLVRSYTVAGEGDEANELRERRIAVLRPPPGLLPLLCTDERRPVRPRRGEGGRRGFPKERRLRIWGAGRRRRRRRRRRRGGRCRPRTGATGKPTDSEPVTILFFFH